MGLMSQEQTLFWGVPDVAGYVVMSLRSRHTNAENALFNPKKAMIRALSTLFSVPINVISNG